MLLGLVDGSVTDTIGRLGVALAAGALVGLQRQYADQADVSTEQPSKDLLAGTRTLALIGLLGGLASVLQSELGSVAVFIAVFAVVGSFAALGYWMVARRGDVGMTTELAVLVTFIAGALAGRGEFQLAAAIAVGATALLALKPYTKRFIAKIDERDVMATLQFAVLAALILPVLPRDPIGDEPFDAASPFKVGLMVVFILGLSFLGYVLIKVVGARRGIGLTGLLGGLVSSTAVTLTMSERSKHSAGLLRPLTTAVLISWTIMYARVLVEVGVVHRGLLSSVWLPIGLAGAVTLGCAGYVALRRDTIDDGASDGEFANPFSIGPAIKFGMLYGAVLIGSKALSMYLGDTGVYVGAIVSGLADVDAITLSMAELSRGNGEVSDSTAASAIVLAAASNALVKGGLVWVGAAPAMRKWVVPAVVGSIALSVAATFLL